MEQTFQAMTPNLPVVSTRKGKTEQLDELLFLLKVVSIQISEL